MIFPVTIIKKAHPKWRCLIELTQQQRARKYWTSQWHLEYFQLVWRNVWKQCESTKLSHTKKKPRQHLTEREPHFCWSHFKGIHAFQFECAALNVCPFNKASSVLWKFSRQLPFSTALNIGRKALLCSIVLTILLIIVPGSCVISYWFFPSVSPWDN